MSQGHIARSPQTHKADGNLRLWMLQPNVASLRKIGFAQNKLARRPVNAVCHEHLLAIYPGRCLRNRNGYGTARRPRGCHVFVTSFFTLRWLRDDAFHPSRAKAERRVPSFPNERALTFS